MKKGNLLIVDDEKLILDRLVMILEEFADKLFTAEDGKKALEILSKETIHCVVCDINMPNLNGVEVIKQLRKENNDVPFIFYTAHGSQDLMLEAVKYGAFDFLNKPDLYGLEETVKRGLLAGTKSDAKTGHDIDESHMSEYQKLLDQLAKK